RLDPKTIRVVPVVNERQSYVLAILFDIYGTCSLPGDEMLVNLRIALDYSCGAVHVFD
ncbi:TPA: type VI secretion system baseplate subunit TssE, partial [Serratia marcescens]